MVIVFKIKKRDGDQRGVIPKPSHCFFNRMKTFLQYSFYIKF